MLQQPTPVIKLGTQDLPQIRRPSPLLHRRQNAQQLVHQGERPLVPAAKLL
jgi:hypothetical protein